MMQGSWSWSGRGLLSEPIMGNTGLAAFVSYLYCSFPLFSSTLSHLLGGLPEGQNMDALGAVYVPLQHPQAARLIHLHGRQQGEAVLIMHSTSQTGRPAAHQACPPPVPAHGLARPSTPRAEPTRAGWCQRLLAHRRAP